MQRRDIDYSQKELQFISSHLIELVPAAVVAHRKDDLVCYHTLLNYIGSVVYSWYISYDFDAIPWIRKMFCTAVQFSTFRRLFVSTRIQPVPRFFSKERPGTF